MKILFYCCLVQLVSSTPLPEEIVSGQPTHFQMDDRSPELEINANDQGVKIKAKPATLQVMSHPEEVHFHEPEELSHIVVQKMPHVHYAPPLIQQTIDPIYYGGRYHHHHHLGHYYGRRIFIDGDDDDDGDESYKKGKISKIKQGQKARILKLNRARLSTKHKLN